MKQTYLLVLAITAFAAMTTFPAEPVEGKTLYVYDEVNKESAPYVDHFRSSFRREGIGFDEATAADLTTKDLSVYDCIVIHGMVMAFNMKSPIRDWLKTGPSLEGKKVSLFVTANRWFLDKLFGELTALLKRNKAETIDAVSMATKETDGLREEEAVIAHVARLKEKMEQ